MKKLLFGALGSMLLALPAVSSAVPMTWTYNGACTWGDCAEVPTITGSLSGDPTLVGPNNELNQFSIFGDLISYSFTLGSYTFGGSSAVGKYDLDAAGNIVGGLMVFENVFSLEFLGVGNASWEIFDKDCSLFRGCQVDVHAGGTGGYTNVSVPEPATLGLMGLALLGAGVVRRRKNG